VEDGVGLVMTVYKVQICGFFHDFGWREFDQLGRVSQFNNMSIGLAAKISPVESSAEYPPPSCNKTSSTPDVSLGTWLRRLQLSQSGAIEDKRYSEVRLCSIRSIRSSRAFELPLASPRPQEAYSMRCAIISSIRSSRGPISSYQH